MKLTRRRFVTGVAAVVLAGLPLRWSLVAAQGAGDGARLAMLLLHDDAEREYAYGPAQGLPATRVGGFTRREVR